MRFDDIRSFSFLVRGQLRAHWFAILCTSAFSVAVVFLLYMLGNAREINLGELTRDVAAVAGVPPFVGALSTLGLIFWSASLGICCLGFLLLRARKGFGREAEFLLVAGVFTLLLLIDDAFMVHDHYLDRESGSIEWIVYAVYAAFLASYGLRYGRVLLDGPLILFLGAVGALGISAGYDAIMPFDANRGVFIEDAFKFAGIVFWWTFHLTFVSARLQAPRTDRAPATLGQEAFGKSALLRTNRLAARERH